MSEEQEAREKEPFVVDSVEKADWVLRKIMAYTLERDFIKAQAKRRADECQAEINALERQFGPQLEEFARQERERRKRQTITLLYGTLAFRAHKAGLKLTDRAKATEYAETGGFHRDQFFRPIRQLDENAYMVHAEEWFEDTGEVIAGVERTEAGESFTVRINAGKGEAGE